MKSKFATNRPMGILIKAVFYIIRSFYALSVRYQVRKCGNKIKVFGSVLISAGNSITLGHNCSIGRNVILDATHGAIELGDGVEIRDNVRIYSKGVTIGSGTTLAEGAFLVGAVGLGTRVWISRGCDLTGPIQIEEGVILGPYVSSNPSDHGREATGAVSLYSASIIQPICIRKGSWVGLRSVLLKGVEIGENAVVGAGSVVTKTVASGDVVAGVPAKPIKSKLSRS